MIQYPSFAEQNPVCLSVYLLCIYHFSTEPSSNFRGYRTIEKTELNARIASRSHCCSFETVIAKADVDLSALPPQLPETGITGMPTIHSTISS